MNEPTNQPTLQQQVFDYIKEAAEKIGDFATKEIPPFIEEFLRWRFFEAGIEALLLLILCILPVYVLLKWKTLLNWALKHQHNSDGFSWAGFATAILASIGLLLLAFPLEQIKDMIQIQVAPKVYLLEQCAEYLK
jgi:hypothetical protein